VGLSQLPGDLRPADHLVTTVHLAFDVMVGIGFALLALALWYAVLWWRRRAVSGRPTDDIDWRQCGGWERDRLLPW